MTIFLEIVKKFLETEITKVRDSSVEADAGFCNTIVSFAGYGRDTELSSKKRQYAVDLLVDLRNMKDKDKDYTSCEYLKTLINGYKEKAKLASDLKNYNEGTFGPAMQAAISLADDILKKLGAVSLLDIQHDDDPFNEFRYQMAHYFAQKVVDARTTSVVSTVMSNPKITSSIQVAKEKEALILRSLVDCEKDLKTLDIEHVDYVTTRKRRVLEKIKAMKEENVGVCKEHTTELSVPVLQFSFFSKVNLNVPTMGPEVGFLDECLNLAADAIKKSMVAEESKEALVF